MLADFILGDLPRDVARAVTAHLGHCPSCRKLWVVSKHLIRFLAEA